MKFQLLSAAQRAKLNAQAAGQLRQTFLQMAARAIGGPDADADGDVGAAVALTEVDSRRLATEDRAFDRGMRVYQAGSWDDYVDPNH